MLHPLDIANLISGDHRLAETLFRRIEQGEGNRQVLFHQVGLNVAVHAGGEEQVFYPAMQEHGATDEAAENLADHQAVKDALIVLDRHEAGSAEAEEAMATIISTIRSHAAGEEKDDLPALRMSVGDAGMVDLGAKFVAAQRKAPTHAHPHASSNPLIAVPSALVDKLRDKRSGSDNEAATDASGLLDPQAQELVDTFAGLGVKPPHLLDPKAARQQPTMADAVKALLKKRGQDTHPEPVGLIIDGTIPGPAGTIPIRIYQPAVPATADALLPVIVYVHGGGWVLADLDVYDASCRALANRTGCMLISVEYRHAPEHRFPAAHEDVLAATQWVLVHGATLGGDPARVALVGESAGGNMVASTCIALNDVGGLQPCFQVLIYPVASTTMDSSSYLEAADAKPLYSGFMNWFFGHLINDPQDLGDPRLHLLSIPEAQLAGLPAALVITAERDPLRDEGEAYAERLRSAGVPVEATRYDGVPHEFFGAGAVLDKSVEAQMQAANALQAAFGISTTASPGTRNYSWMR